MSSTSRSSACRTNGSVKPLSHMSYYGRRRRALLTRYVRTYVPSSRPTRCRARSSCTNPCRATKPARWSNASYVRLTEVEVDGSRRLRCWSRHHERDATDDEHGRDRRTYSEPLVQQQRAQQHSNEWVDVRVRRDE